MRTASGRKVLKALMDNRVFVIGRDTVPGAVSLKAGESLRWTFVVTSACKLDLTVDIQGEGCDVDIAALYVCGGSDRADFKVEVRHNSGGSVSRQLFKGIVSGSAKVSFDGLIYVAPDAQRTKAYQENHTILLSEGARVETRPQLEIYADDVECSHGATTGYLSAEELFYMRSRGISEKDARRLQIISFLSPILERLDGTLRGQILEKI